MTQRLRPPLFDIKSLKVPTTVDNSPSALYLQTVTNNFDIEGQETNLNKNVVTLG